ncbi:MAG: ABC transporter ATP-binding protein [Acidimicrobiia bacterium]|nr:ABC transporter ATP-binding protein [Acidimicrobiia bacterium]
MSEKAIELAGMGKRFTKYEDTPMLVTRALRFRARTRRSQLWALRNIDFEVARGECVGVIGRNGSGKSTMLTLLAGVTGPTEGRVTVRGSVAPLISVGIGFHPELTGRENVYVNGTVLGMTRKQIDQRFDGIVDFAEIGPFVDTPVKFYSSGMQLRLGFAVAVASEPEILLVDEVLAVGDLAFQLKCFKRMGEIIESGATIVVVSHNLPAIRNLCPRTMVLHYGAKRFDGDTREAIQVYHELLGEQRDIEDPLLAGAGSSFAGRFEHIELRGPDGERTAHVGSGDEVEIQGDVVFDAPVEDPVFGFGVTTESGVVVYTDSTPLFQGVRGFAAGSRAQFRARFRLGVTTGPYEIHVNLQRLRDGEMVAKPPVPIPVYVSGRDGVHGLVDLAAELTVARDESGGAAESAASAESAESA